MEQKRLEKAQQEIYDLLSAFGIDLEGVSITKEKIKIGLFDEENSKIITITWPDAEARDSLLRDKRGMALFVMGSMLKALCGPRQD